MSEWQDISTAPRDLTPIIVYCPIFGVTVAQFEMHAMPAFWSVDTHDIHGSDGFVLERIECKPTHWMPLPDDPAPPHSS